MPTAMLPLLLEMMPPLLIRRGDFRHAIFAMDGCYDARYAAALDAARLLRRHTMSRASP